MHRLVNSERGKWVWLGLILTALIGRWMILHK